MRDWGVDPKFMCKKHLLGNHLELHMFLGCILKGKNIDGYIKSGFVEIHNIKSHHDRLVEEMKRRGYNHKSPLIVPHQLRILGEINKKKSLMELKERCKDCRGRML
jgi:hypothetical protein